MVEKSYEERISGYGLDQLYDVEKNIDSSAHPDRYELVLKEIENRKNGIGTEEVIKSEIKSALDSNRHESSGNRKIHDMQSFIISCVFGLVFVATLFYKEEIEHKYGSLVSTSTFLLLIFSIYFGRKAWAK